MKTEKARLRSQHVSARAYQSCLLSTSGYEVASRTVPVYLRLCDLSINIDRSTRGNIVGICMGRRAAISAEYSMFLVSQDSNITDHVRYVPS